MANPKRQRSKMHRTIAESLIPETGTYGDVWLATDTNAIYFCGRNGLTFCVNDVLDGIVAHTPPRHGKDGAVGPKGDSIVGPAGKDGQSIVGPAGPAGPKGDRGDLTIIGDSELLAGVQKLKEEKTRWLASLQLQLERNAGRKHTGLQKAIDNVLQTLQSDAGVQH